MKLLVAVMSDSVVCLLQITVVAHVKTVSSCIEDILTRIAGFANCLLTAYAAYSNFHAAPVVLS